MSRTLSEAQLAANRANAARSTGPRTPEGKARSAQNARKHGFTATTFTVVRIEEIDELANLRADLIAHYQPANSQELFAIERMALAQHAMLRASRLEVGLFTHAVDRVVQADLDHLMTPELAGDGDIEITRAQNRNFLLADGFAETCRNDSKSWTLFLRYQAQAERLYRRSLEEFHRARAEAATLPEPLADPILEPIPDDQLPLDPSEPARPSAPETPFPNEPISAANSFYSHPLPPPQTNRIPPRSVPED